MEGKLVALGNLEKLLIDSFKNDEASSSDLIQKYFESIKEIYENIYDRELIVKYKLPIRLVSLAASLKQIDLDLLIEITEFCQAYGTVLSQARALSVLARVSGDKSYYERAMGLYMGLEDLDKWMVDLALHFGRSDDLLKIYQKYGTLTDDPLVNAYKAFLDSRALWKQYLANAVGRLKLKGSLPEVLKGLQGADFPAEFLLQLAILSQVPESICLIDAVLSSSGSLECVSVSTWTGVCETLNRFGKGRVNPIQGYLLYDGHFYRLSPQILGEAEIPGDTTTSNTPMTTQEEEDGVLDEVLRLSRRKQILSEASPNQTESALSLSKTLLVVDTNVLISKPLFLEKFADLPACVAIPLVVLEELTLLTDHPVKQKTIAATRALEWLENEYKPDDYKMDLYVLTTQGKLSHDLSQRRDPTTLKPASNDKVILQACQKYNSAQRGGKRKAVVITDDTNMRLIARAMLIDAYASVAIERMEFVI